MLTCAAIAILPGACSGPQPLSVAILPQHEQAYLKVIAERSDTQKDAFFAMKARAAGSNAATEAQADSRLSTTRNPFDAYKDFDAVSRGAVLYKVYCMSCHGPDARGQGPAMPARLPKMDFHAFGKRFAATLHRGAPRAWFRKIHDGHTSKVINEDGSKNTMPAFGDILAREQIWQTISYLQSLDRYSDPARSQ